MAAAAAGRLAADLPDATGERWRTPARQRGCPGCGLFQLVPSMLPGSAARCVRCGTLLRRAREAPLGRALALNLAALSILAIACAMPLMTVSTAAWCGTPI